MGGSGVGGWRWAKVLGCTRPEQGRHTRVGSIGARLRPPVHRGRACLWTRGVRAGGGLPNGGVHRACLAEACGAPRRLAAGVQGLSQKRGSTGQPVLCRRGKGGGVSGP